MVLIEEKTTADEVKEAAKDRDTNVSAVESGDAGSEKVSKDVAEGFETASEGDLDDDKEVELGGGDGKREVERSEGVEEEVSPPKSDAYEDALSEDELKQVSFLSALIGVICVYWWGKHENLHI